MKNMTLFSIIVITLLFAVFVDGEEDCYIKESVALQSNRTFSRKKRYLAFPSGSAFVATITLLEPVQLKEPKNWNLDLEFDMIWPIPNQETLYRKPYKRIKPFHRTRRHKRDLYANIELALASQGLPGKECLLRTICEARTYLNIPGVSFVDDILRIILSHENPSKKKDEYDVAYRKKSDCDLEYRCPISLLDLLLNHDPQFLSQE